jgi:hypothetical protein
MNDDHQEEEPLEILYDRLVEERRLFNLLVGMPTVYYRVANFVISYDYDLEDLPDDFWEPVKVGLDSTKLDQLETLIKNQDCFICCDSRQAFIPLPCCKHELCTECSVKWFMDSVFCPYCKQDLREKLIKETINN